MKYINSYKSIDKRIFIVAIAITITSQFNLNLLTPGFVIAISGIILPIFLYLYEDLNPFQVGIASGIISPIVRYIIVYLQTNDLSKTITMVTPDIFFYFTYGTVFYFLFFKNEKKNLTRFIFVTFWSDFLSNMTDLFIRTHIVNMSIDIAKVLMMVAFVRTLIIAIIILIIKYYKSLLKKEEHEIRYRNLVLLTSNFKSEIFFMNKNISEIEDVMKKSYSIYKLTLEKGYMKELQDLALCISKDVHEIKKDYIRVIKGIEKFSKDKITTTNMNIKDIINILEIDTKEYIKLNSLDIHLTFNLRTNFIVHENYYMMTVINNLIYNSIDALSNRENGTIKLTIYKNNIKYILSVSDNGIGIKKSNLDFIFNPGFSTKFDSNTGDINRGIGLALAKDLVESFFQGTILVESVENKGTTFTIMFPTHVFNAHEDGKAPTQQFKVES